MRSRTHFTHSSYGIQNYFTQEQI
uniref:Uncharacterized protein n=1 Tax=Anguilla anguilla TaxID=7936 RepID=A0A0E9V448_ANGAN